MRFDNDYPLVTLVIAKGQYAISSQFVSTMVAEPKTRPVPHAPPYVRGIINLRSKVMPLIDLRLRMGYPSARKEQEEFRRLMEQGEQDHVNWLNELEASVEEGREFSLTTDPAQCDFGKWYASFRTGNNTLRSFLKKFNQPHRKIHALAHKVKALSQAGRHEEARRLIAIARHNELKTMVQLFQKTSKIIAETHREIAMIIETPTFDYGVAIDQILAVEFLGQGTIEDLPPGLEMQTSNNIVGLIGRRQTDNSTVQILDPMRICDPDDVKGLILNPEQAREPEPAKTLTPA